MSVLGVAVFAALLTACGIVGGKPPLNAGMPSMASRCRVGATQTSVLVTEWSGAEKANLETLLRGGAVAVEFSGCQMRLLPQCQLAGEYHWQRTSPSTDIVEIKNEAELFAKLPLGAVALSGELKQSGNLYVETTVSGQNRLYGTTAAEVPRTVECMQATHIIDAMTVGAFVLSAGSEQTAGSSVEVETLGSAGGSVTRSARVLRYAGNAQACGYSTEEAPSGDCNSPVQVFLSPIPGQAEVEGPPGTVRVDFESGDASTRWDVYVEDEATCTTPCDHWVDPNRPLLLRTRKDKPDKLRIGGLEPSGGPLQVIAYPTSKGKLATGITFTALGGLSLATGITLTALGYSTDRSSFRTAGIINIGAGGLVTAGSILLILDALPKYKVRSLFGADTMTVGPGYVAGSF